jgi:DNA-binding transcriptional regulator YdaS (Cro superfamily)
VGVANQFANLAAVEPGALTQFGATLLPAGAPRLATSGTGGFISAVSESVGVGPPKLPQVLSGQTNLSPTQIVGQLTQAAASLGPRRSAAPGSTGGPSTQQIVKEE